MDIEKLIKDVTEQVYKKIVESDFKEKGKKIILVPDTEEIRNKYSLFISNWGDIDFIDKEIKSIDKYDHIICPELTNKDLIDISLGRANSQISSLLIEALFKGKQITCVEEGLEYGKYKNQANKSFFELFEKYKDTLVNYGIEFIRLTELKDILISDKRILTRKVISIEDKIITESYIKKLWEQGFDTVKLPKNSITTPLSEDFMKKNSIKVIYY